MKKNKKIPKYNFGGKLEKGLKDYALGMADSTLAVVGLDNVVKDDQYSDTGFGNFAKKTSNITGAIGKTALPIAANIVAPGSGKFVSMGQQAIGQFNPQDPSQFDAQGNPIDPNMQTAKQAIGNLGAVGVAATDLMNDNKKNLPTTTITRTGSAPNPSNLYTNQYSPEWNSLNNNSAEGTGVLPNQDPNIQTSRYGGIKYPNGGKIPKLKPRDFKAEKAHYEEQTRGANQADGSGISSAELAYRYSKLIDPTGATSAVEIGKNFYNGNPQDPIDYLGLVRVPFVSQGMKPLSKLAKQGNKASVLINTITKTNDVAESFRAGGMMGDKYGNGGAVPREFANSEVELEENTLNPDGTTTQFDGNSHEQGGIPTNLDPGTLIFSDKLKKNGKTFAELNKVNNTNKEDKVLESNKYGTTSKRTAELMKFAKNKNSEELFNAQEALKQAKVEAYAKKMGVTLPQPNTQAPQEFAMGGVKLPMYPLGGGTDNTKFTPAQKQQAYTDSMTLYKSGFNKNIPNWQAEPGFNDAVLRLNKLNGTPPQSTDKSAITYDQSYLQKRSVPYAKPVAPKVNYQNKPSTITPNYPMEILPMKKLEYPEMEIKSDFKQVPANKPSTIKTNIVTGPNMSYKEYKQGNEVMDRMYFKPGTEEEIEVTGFKYGGRKLPKFWTGGKMVNGTWVPDNYDIITAHNATNSYKPGTIGYYDSMNSPDKPSNDSLQSSYGPDVLPWNRSNDSGNSAAYDNTVNPQQFQEVTSNSKSNIGSPKVTDPNDKNFDWGKLKTVGQNYGNFALQNAGNIYDLTRKQDPLQKYDRATAKFLDPSSAIRDALAQTRRAEYNVRGASGGNAGTYLSNRVALNAQNTENLARIHQNYQNANAQISNQNSQFNTEIAYREAEAQAKDRAMRQNVNSQAIHSMASNFGKMSKSSKQDNMEQKELDMFMYRYKNEPGFKEQVDKFRTA